MSATDLGRMWLRERAASLRDSADSVERAYRTEHMGPMCRIVAAAYRAAAQKLEESVCLLDDPDGEEVPHAPRNDVATADAASPGGAGKGGSEHEAAHEAVTPSGVNARGNALPVAPGGGSINAENECDWKKLQAPDGGGGEPHTPVVEVSFDDLTRRTLLTAAALQGLYTHRMVLEKDCDAVALAASKAGDAALAAMAKLDRSKP